MNPEKKKMEEEEKAAAAAQKAEKAAEEEEQRRQKRERENQEKKEKRQREIYELKKKNEYKSIAQTVLPSFPLLQASPIVLNHQQNGNSQPLSNPINTFIPQNPVPLSSFNSHHSHRSNSIINTLNKKLNQLDQTLAQTTDVVLITRLAEAIKEIAKAKGALNLCENASIISASTNDPPIPNPPVQVGQPVPDVNIWSIVEESDGLKKVEMNLRNYCDKPTVLFAVPGAFTSTCTKKHLPEIADWTVEFEEMGFENVACISVNDPYTMYHWGKTAKALGLVDMLADPEGKLAKELGLSTYKGSHMGDRFIRSAFVIIDNTFRIIRVDEKGYSETSPESLCKSMKGAQNQI